MPCPREWFMVSAGTRNVLSRPSSCAIPSNQNGNWDGKAREADVLTGSQSEWRKRSLSRSAPVGVIFQTRAQPELTCAWTPSSRGTEFAWGVGVRGLHARVSADSDAIPGHLGQDCTRLFEVPSRPQSMKAAS